MSENITSTASSMDQALVASQAEVALITQKAVSKPVSVEGKEPVREEEQPNAKAAEAGSGANVVNPLTDFTLEFQVDESTNDVTVYILDRASHEVVRTIPPEELNNLNPGDLLQLFA